MLYKSIPYTSETIAEADAIGDPSLQSDALTQRDRIALETYRDARAVVATLIACVRPSCRCGWHDSR